MSEPNTGTMTEAGLSALAPDVVFDGGDLDCGSGLVLLIREHMLRVPVGGVLEMKSSEPTVGDDLPPWCRMSGHGYLGRIVSKGPGAAPGQARYFVRRGEQSRAEDKALAEDKKRARDYVWRLRTRSTGHQKATVYCRNFSWVLGQAASFEEKDAHPSAVEALLGALGASLASAYATECARRGLEVDDIELAVSGRLHNILAHLGMEEGDPSFAEITVKCYASTLDDADAARAAFADVAARSPIAATLAKAATLNLTFSVV